MKEKIPLPPLQAQQRIVEMLRYEYQIRKRVAHFSKLLDEYRTRLVADVVTGKLDVRAVAAQLPEEASGDDPMDGAYDTSQPPEAEEEAIE